MPALEKYSLKQLQDIANRIRKDIINMLVEAGSGHAAGALGMADVFTGLYFQVIDHKPRQPNWPDRDRVVVSNGHICPVLYATLAQAGYFAKEELKTLRKIGTRLQGHPSLLDLPGVEISSGPLGQGISQAIGIALAGKMDQKKYEVYCLMGDGEQDEGQVWEALMFAGKHQLHNLTVIIDRNRIQISGGTEEVMPLEPLREKYQAFNWLVLDIDGHNFEEIIDACYKAKTVFDRPVAIIAHTIPGKGVEFMEYKQEWHGKTINKNLAQKALEDLKSL